MDRVLVDTSSKRKYIGTMAEGYGKRPLWQWIVLYVIIGGVIYAAFYYFVIAKKVGLSGFSY